MILSKEQFEELCSAYAIGALEEDGIAVLFSALNDGDDEIRKIYAESIGVSYLLNQSVTFQAPSPLVKRNMFRRISKGPKRPFSFVNMFDSIALSLGFGNPRFGLIVSLLLVVVIGEIAAYGYTMFTEVQEREEQIAAVESKLGELNQLTALQTELERQKEILNVLQSPKIEVVLMNGLEANPAGYGKIIWDPVRKIAILQVSKLPSIPEDKDYQLWFINKANTPVSAGVFNVTDSNENYFKVSEIPVPDKNEISTFAVTLEPKGGVQQPTGTMYLQGSPTL